MINLKQIKFWFLILLSTSTSIVNGQNFNLKDINWHLKNTFKVVAIKNGKVSKTGSGYIVYCKKVIEKQFRYYSITNEHVLENSDSAYLIFNDNKVVPITSVLDTYHDLDITLFSFNGELDSLGYFTRPSIKTKILNQKCILGENVLTVSSPKGLINSLSSGILAANRIIGKRSLLQFTAPISGGSSGGVLLNSNNLPIGVIVSQFSEGQNINFAVPLKDIIERITSKYSSIEFSKISFISYSIRNLDKYIEMDWNKAIEIVDLYKKDKTLAYSEIEKLDYNELVANLWLIKWDFEIENHKWLSLFKSQKFYLKKYRFDALISLFYVFETNSLINDTDIKEDVFEAFQEVDPDNEYFTKTYIDYIKCNYFYKNKDYQEALQYFGLVEKIVSKYLNGNGEDSSVAFFINSFSYSLYYKIGTIYYEQNDYENASKPLFKSFSLLMLEKDSQSYLASIGYEVFFCFIKTNRTNAACDFYKKYLVPIENYLDKDIRAKMRNTCK